MADLKKTWSKPVLVALTPSIVASGIIAQSGNEGVKFLNSKGCGVSGTVFASKSYVHTPTVTICKDSVPCKSTVWFYGASSDTDLLVALSVGLCS